MDLIDRQNTISAIENEYGDTKWEEFVKIVIEIINEQPSQKQGTKCIAEIKIDGDQLQEMVDRAVEKYEESPVEAVGRKLAGGIDAFIETKCFSCDNLELQCKLDKCHYKPKAIKCTNYEIPDMPDIQEELDKLTIRSDTGERK